MSQFTFRSGLKLRGTQVLEGGGMAPVPEANLARTCRAMAVCLPSWGAQGSSAYSPLRREMDLEVNPEAKGHIDSEHSDCQGS